MTDTANFENAVTEINEGVIEEVHAIEDIETATDFELKHTPNIEVIEQVSGRLIKVTIGLKGIAHPQTEEHLTEWIRAFDGTEPLGTVTFGSDDVPYAEFKVAQNDSEVIVQALCNLHGLWEARI